MVGYSEDELPTMPATTRLKKFFLKGKRALAGEAKAGAGSTPAASGGDKPSGDTSAALAAELDADGLAAGAGPEGGRDGTAR